MCPRGQTAEEAGAARAQTPRAACWSCYHHAIIRAEKQINLRQLCENSSKESQSLRESNSPFFQHTHPWVPFRRAQKHHPFRQLQGEGIHKHPGRRRTRCCWRIWALPLSPYRQRQAGEPKPSVATAATIIATLESRALGHGVREKVLLPYLVRLKPLHHPNVLPQQVVQRPVVVEREGAFHFFFFVGTRLET